MLKLNYYLVFILLLGINCTGRKIKENDRVKDTDLINANWITDSKDLPLSDCEFFEDRPAAIFRKEFSVKKNLKSAKLYISAAGYYVAGINGKRTGEICFDPAWTNYSKRIYYSEYDVSQFLSADKNCIGVSTGNGFYNLLPIKMWGNNNLREKLPSGNPAFISKLELIYSDGSVEEIVSDNSWKYSYGPIVRNNVYLGDVYDARREIPDWDLPGFDDSSWIESIENEGPGGQLQKTFFPPFQLVKIIEPVSIVSPSDGKYIVDMGVNFTGLYRIKLKGNKGDTVTFRFGERIYENGELNPMTAVAGQIKMKGKGGVCSPDTAWQTDKYIFGENRNISYCPDFTFHVYRYMEISGLDYKPELADIEGLMIHTNVENNSLFSSSSGLLNSIQDAAVRTFLSNLISVQSDCPGREKFGYGGDLNATSEAFIYNFDMQAFYRKTIYDWTDAMIDSIFIDTAPYVGIKYCGLSWESAFLITQYMLYLYYNDIDFIKELYPLNLKWMEKAERIHPGGFVDKGLGDHESLEHVPATLIGTSHYLQCARIMKLFAKIFNDKKNETKFESLEKKIQNILLEKFWKQPFKDPINKQTLFSVLLYYKILPEDQEKNAIDSLFNELKRAPSGHFTTGIFGTRYILEVLSEKGYIDSVFQIVNSSEYPGWGYMISRGATTIWETWKESDNIYSNCHPMFGSVSEWFYKWLGGIRPDPDNPGFKKFIIDPHLPEGLDSISCIYSSSRGEIVSKWKKFAGGKIVFEITVPAKSNAFTRLPVKSYQDIIMTKNEKILKIPYKDDGQNHIKMNLKPGQYNIEIVNKNL